MKDLSEYLKTDLSEYLNPIQGMIKNFEKVVVLLANDTYVNLDQWQRMYGLPVGSASIGQHFKFTEFKFNEDIERYGKLVVCAPLIQVLDKYRELVGPVTINSFNRDDIKQAELKAAGARAATTSPHVQKMAADVDTTTKEETEKNAAIMLQAGKSIGIPIRVGFKDYIEKGQSFVHVDVCPLFYGNDGPRHHEPHPPVWEEKWKTW